MDCLRHIVPRGKYKSTTVVFDEFNYRKVNTVGMSAEECIALLDMSTPATLPARYKDIVIPAGLPRIFTTNLDLMTPTTHIFPPGANAEQQAGIDRRYRIIDVPEAMWAVFEPAGIAP